MKVVSFSLLALLVGTLAGWPWGRDAVAGDGKQRVSEGGKAEPAWTPKSASSPQRRDHAITILGNGWHMWAEEIKAAKTTAQLENLFDELVMATDRRQPEDRTLRTTVGRLLGARWVELDPAAGMVFLNASKDQGWVLYPLMAEWLLRDQGAALAALPAEGEKMSGLDTHVEILKHLVRRDPDASLAFMKVTWKYDTQVAFDPASGAAWRKLARKRPQEFAALITEIEASKLKEGERFGGGASLITIAAEEFARQDPEAALRWADADYDPRIRGEALSSVLRTWIELDAQRVAELITRWRMEEPNSARARAGGGVTLWLAQAMAREELPVAMEWLQGRSDTNPKQFAESLAIEIAKGHRSVTEVYDALSEISPENQFEVNTVFRGMWDRLATHELTEAFGTLQEKPSSLARTGALAGLLRTTMEANPPRALAMLNQVPPGPERAALLRELFQKTDLERRAHTAEQVVSALPDEDRALAIGVLFAGEPEPVGQRSPNFNPGLFAETLENVAPSEARTTAVERLALHWGDYDPAAAMEWAQGLPAADAVAVSTLAARAWIKQDPWSLADDLLERPEGAPRDAATVALVESVQREQPDTAWAWSSRIGDPALRGEWQRAVIQRWSNAHPEAARVAVEQAQLSAGEREALRNILSK